MRRSHRSKAQLLPHELNNSLLVSGHSAGPQTPLVVDTPDWDCIYVDLQ